MPSGKVFDDEGPAFVDCEGVSVEGELDENSPATVLALRLVDVADCDACGGDEVDGPLCVVCGTGSFRPSGVDDLDRGRAITESVENGTSALEGASEGGIGTDDVEVWEELNLLRAARAAASRGLFEEEDG